jgi:hypothetical protein
MDNITGGHNMEEEFDNDDEFEEEMDAIEDEVDSEPMDWWGSDSSPFS